MMADYTGRTLPESGRLSPNAPNDDNGRRAEIGRVVLKLCHCKTAVRTIQYIAPSMGTPAKESHRLATTDGRVEPRVARYRPGCA